MEEPFFSIAKFSAKEADTSQIPTCAAASSKFVALGLSDGSVALYDVFGNCLECHQKLHVGSVSAIALSEGYAHDEIVASAGSVRGDIRVVRLTTTSASKQFNMLSGAVVCFERPTDARVIALAVDPNFGKPRYGERIAYALNDGRLILYTYGWFGGVEVIVQKKSSYQIACLAWVHHLLAFATRDGVRVFDTRTNKLACLVTPPGSSAPVSPMRKPAVSNLLKAEESIADEPKENVENKQIASPRAELVLPKESKSEESNIQTLNTRLKGKNGWVLATKIVMTESDEEPLSPTGEPTVLLHVTWPSGARVVKIGPHKNILPTENVPLRNISVTFKLERESLPSAKFSEKELQTLLDATGSIVEESPLLSLVPFGAKTNVVLVGTPWKGLIMHLISAEGVSLESTRMPHEELRDADMLIIPGGDPLVLIIGKPNSMSKGGTIAEKPGLVYVRCLTTAERVKWLLGQHRFSDALAVAQSTPGGSLRRAEVSLEDIGEQFLESLHENGDYEGLASVLPETIVTTSPYVGFRVREKIMVKRQKRWKRWIQVFRNGNKLDVVAPVVPTYEPCLDKDTYNAILTELCRTDPDVMLLVLKTWPADVYSVSVVTKAIEEVLQEMKTDSSRASEHRKTLSDGLLMMYGLSGRHDELLGVLLRDGSPKVYDYIRSHHLYEAVRSVETIAGLFSIDGDKATEILAHAPETVLPPEAVVPILTKIDNPSWSFMYLHSVFKLDCDNAPKYQNQLLKLYINHGGDGMLFNFLKTSTHYSLDRALREMGGPKGTKKGHLARERVYVLSAMGDLNSAMDILLDELGDTFEAIEFASDHGDTALWERLIQHAGTHADTLAALLDSPAGGKVDPVRLIPLLSSEMRIPHLRDRLHRILVDAALERSLREDAAAALHHDASELLEELDRCVAS